MQRILATTAVVFLAALALQGCGTTSETTTTLTTSLKADPVDCKATDFFMDMDCISQNKTDLKVFGGISSAGECCVLCTNFTGVCQAWAYNEYTELPRYRGRCFLKADACVGGKEPVKGLISGIFPPTPMPTPVPTPTPTPIPTPMPTPMPSHKKALNCHAGKSCDGWNIHQVCNDQRCDLKEGFGIAAKPDRSQRGALEVSDCCERCGYGNPLKGCVVAVHKQEDFDGVCEFYKNGSEIVQQPGSTHMKLRSCKPASNNTMKWVFLATLAIAGLVLVILLSLWLARRARGRQPGVDSSPLAGALQVAAAPMQHHDAQPSSWITSTTTNVEIDRSMNEASHWRTKAKAARAAKKTPEEVEKLKALERDATAKAIAAASAVVGARDRLRRERASCDVRYLLASVPEYDLSEHPTLAFCIKVTAHLGIKNVAGDAKDTFHTSVLSAEEMAVAKKGWRTAWQGKVCTGIDFTLSENSAAPIMLITLVGGPECEWEQEQLAKTIIPSFEKTSTKFELKTFDNWCSLLQFLAAEK